MKKIAQFLLYLLIIPLYLLIASSPAHASTTSSLLPVADGTYAQFTPNSGSVHYVKVDESSCNGNTDFNRETTVGGRDSYDIDISSIPNNAVINQIDIIPCASKNTSGGTNTTFDVFYRLDGADSADAGSYSLSTTTPSSQSATIFSGLSTVKNGSTTLEIGGVYTAGNRGVKLSNISTVITYTIPAPSVTTNDATEMSATYSATLNSTVNPNGFSTTVWYKYGTSNVACSSLPNNTSGVSIGSGTIDVSPSSKSIFSLTPNTLYYFCAVGFNSGGTTYGNVLTFTSSL